MSSPSSSSLTPASQADAQQKEQDAAIKKLVKVLKNKPPDEIVKDLVSIFGKQTEAVANLVLTNSTLRQGLVDVKNKAAAEVQEHKKLRDSWRRKQDYLDYARGTLFRQIVVMKEDMTKAKAQIAAYASILEEQQQQQQQQQQQSRSTSPEKLIKAASSTSLSPAKMAQALAPFVAESEGTSWSYLTELSQMPLDVVDFLPIGISANGEENPMHLMNPSSIGEELMKVQRDKIELDNMNNALHRDMNRMRAEFEHKLKSLMRDHRAELHQKDKEFDALKQEMEFSGAEREKLMEHSRQMALKVIQVEQLENSIHKEMEAKAMEIEELQRKFASSQSRLGALQETYSNTVEGYERTVVELKSEAERFKADFIALQRGAYQGEFASPMEEINFLKSKMEKKTESKRVSQQEVATLTSQLRRMEESKKQIQLELNTVQEMMREMDAEALAQLKAQLQLVTRQKQELEADKKLLTENLDSLRKDRDAVIKKDKANAVVMENMRKELEKVQVKMIRAKLDQEHEQEMLEDKMSEANKLKTQIDRTKSDGEHLVQELSRLRDERDRSTNELRSVAQSKQEMEMKLGSEIQELRAERNRLNDENTRLSAFAASARARLSVLALSSNNSSASNSNANTSRSRSNSRGVVSFADELQDGEQREKKDASDDDSDEDEEEDEEENVVVVEDVNELKTPQERKQEEEQIAVVAAASAAVSAAAAAAAQEAMIVEEESKPQTPVAALIEQPEEQQSNSQPLAASQQSIPPLAPILLQEPLVVVTSPARPLSERDPHDAPCPSPSHQVTKSSATPRAPPSPRVATPSPTPSPPHHPQHLLYPVSHISIPLPSSSIVHAFAQTDLFTLLEQPPIHVHHVLQSEKQVQTDRYLENSNREVSEDFYNSPPMPQTPPQTPPKKTLPDLLSETSQLVAQMDPQDVYKHLKSCAWITRAFEAQHIILLTGNSAAASSSGTPYFPQEHRKSSSISRGRSRSSSSSSSGSVSSSSSRYSSRASSSSSSPRDRSPSVADASSVASVHHSIEQQQQQPVATQKSSSRHSHSRGRPRVMMSSASGLRSRSSSRRKLKSSAGRKASNTSGVAAMISGIPDHDEITGFSHAPSDKQDHSLPLMEQEPSQEDGEYQQKLTVARSFYSRSPLPVVKTRHQRKVLQQQKETLAFIHKLRKLQAEGILGNQDVVIVPSVLQAGTIGNWEELAISSPIQSPLLKSRKDQKSGNGNASSSSSFRVKKSAGNSAAIASRGARNATFSGGGSFTYAKGFPTPPTSLVVSGSHQQAKLQQKSAALTVPASEMVPSSFEPIPPPDIDVHFELVASSSDSEGDKQQAQQRRTKPKQKKMSPKKRLILSDDEEKQQQQQQEAQSASQVDEETEGEADMENESEADQEVPAQQVIQESAEVEAEPAENMPPAAVAEVVEQKLPILSAADIPASVADTPATTSMILKRNKKSRQGQRPRAAANRQQQQQQQQHVHAVSVSLGSSNDMHSANQPIRMAIIPSSDLQRQKPVSKVPSQHQQHALLSSSESLTINNSSNSLHLPSSSSVSQKAQKSSQQPQQQPHQPLLSNKKVDVTHVLSSELDRLDGMNASRQVLLFMPRGRSRRKSRSRSRPRNAQNNSNNNSNNLLSSASSKLYNSPSTRQANRSHSPPPAVSASPSLVPQKASAPLQLSLLSIKHQQQLQLQQQQQTANKRVVPQPSKQQQRQPRGHYMSSSDDDDDASGKEYEVRDADSEYEDNEVTSTTDTILKDILKVLRDPNASEEHRSAAEAFLFSQAKRLSDMQQQQHIHKPQGQQQQQQQKHAHFSSFASAPSSSHEIQYQRDSSTSPSSFSPFSPPTSSHSLLSRGSTALLSPSKSLPSSSASPSLSPSKHLSPLKLLPPSALPHDSPAALAFSISSLEDGKPRTSPSNFKRPSASAASASSSSSASGKRLAPLPGELQDFPLSSWSLGSSPRAQSASAAASPSSSSSPILSITTPVIGPPSPSLVVPRSPGHHPVLPSIGSSSPLSHTSNLKEVQIFGGNGKPLSRHVLPGSAAGVAPPPVSNFGPLRR